MAAACRPWLLRNISQISRCSLASIIQTRAFAQQRSAAALTDQRRSQDDVYLLNYRPKPSYEFKEALEMLRAYAISNLDETVELHLKISMGEKKNKIQAFRGIVLMPKPFGEQKKVLVFAEGEAAQSAKDAGADLVGGAELFQQVTDGTLHFDQCLSTLDILDQVKPLQRILRQKMPTTRRGTATDDIVTAIRTYKQGHPYKCDKHGFLNIGIGKLSFSEEDIKNNGTALVQAIHVHKISSKGKFITRVMLSSTHGPGLLLHPKEMLP